METHIANVNVLLVEGSEDANVIRKVWAQHKFSSNDFQVVDKGGIDRVLSTAGVLIKSGNHKRIGIVVDADTDVLTRWQNIRKILLGLPGAYALDSGSLIPEAPPHDGLIATQSKPLHRDNTSAPFNTRVGVWIMPDNRLSGAIEEFVRTLIKPSDTRLWDYAERCVAGIPENTKPRTENWQAKARIHTYLSWQEQPGIGLSEAITRGVLDGKSSNAAPFVSWLRQLYELRRL